MDALDRHRFCPKDPSHHCYHDGATTGPRYESDVGGELKIRAARHGRSAEEEQRQILREALRSGGSTKPLKEFLLEMPDVGEPLLSDKRLAAVLQRDLLDMLWNDVVMHKYLGFSLRNKLGVALGSAISVLSLVVLAPTSAQAQAPSFGFVNPTIVRATMAQITGEVNPGGKLTSCGVEYGETSAYGNRTACIRTLSGTSIGLAQVSLQSLKASTTYHWRLVATNEDGTARTKDATFVTAPPGAPFVLTLGATSLGANTATLNGRVTPNGSLVLFCVFQIGLTTQYTKSIPCDQNAGSTGFTDVTGTLEGLSPSTEYHYRVVAQNAIGTTLGNDVTFRTPAPPQIVFAVPSAIAATTAEIAVRANPNGKTTSCLVEYGVTQAYEHTADCGMFSGSTSTTRTVTLELLKAHTTYHWHVIVSNEDGTADSKDAVFVTHAPAAPLVTTQSATQIGQTSAIANGSVLPNGSTVTSCVIQFGLTTTYGSTAPCDQTFEDTGRVAVTAALSGLSADTEYHYRVVAQNGIGTTTGADVRFRTLTATP